MQAFNNSRIVTSLGLKYVGAWWEVRFHFLEKLQPLLSQRLQLKRKEMLGFLMNSLTYKSLRRLVGNAKASSLYILGG